MAYGKLIGAKMYTAPNILNKDGKQYINPVDEMYLEFGYLPLEYTTIPDILEGYHLVQSWVDMGDRLVQKWNYEADAETSILIKRLNELKEKVEELTYSLKKISDSVIEVEKKDASEMEKGDFLNPLLYSVGMSVEIGKWYTDGEDLWEAIQSGVPANFEDTQYFDIIVI